MPPQPQVAHDEVTRAVPHVLPGTYGVVEQRHGVPTSAQQQADHLREGSFVFDDEDLSHRLGAPGQGSTPE
jgi:hypothetical protein